MPSREVHFGRCISVVPVIHQGNTLGHRAHPAVLCHRERCNSIGASQWFPAFNKVILHDIDPIQSHCTTERGALHRTHLWGPGYSSKWYLRTSSLSSHMDPLRVMHPSSRVSDILVDLLSTILGLGGEFNTWYR